MKSILKASMIFFFISCVTACSKDSSIPSKEVQNTIIEKTIHFQPTEKVNSSTNETNSQNLSLYFMFDLEQEKPIELIASENLLSLINMTNDEFVAEVERNMYLKTFGNHSSCIEDCKDKYTDDNGNKIKGRGACKANCWIDTAVAVLEAGAAIAKALN